jgi:hypothetical protein
MPVNDSVAQESKKGTAEYARILPLLHRIKLMPAGIMYGTKVSVLGRVCIVVVVVYFVCVQFTLASDMWRGTLSRSATNLQAECPHAWGRTGENRSFIWSELLVKREKKRFILVGTPKKTSRFHRFWSSVAAAVPRTWDTENDALLIPRLH